MPPREWLPSCFDSSSTASSSTSSASASSKKPGYASRARAHLDGVIAPARENAQLASGSDTCCPQLSLSERVQGCVGCFLIGIVISFLSFLSWWTGQIATFAILYTLGNLVALCGSGFLMGPKRQWRNMTRAKRIYATGAYFFFMILTITLACMNAPSLFVLLCVIFRKPCPSPVALRPFDHDVHCRLIASEWCALVWYIASYIPYGE